MAGEETAQRKGDRPGSKLITLTCKNSRCKWFETTYLVGINADGTIPERRHEKEYHPLDSNSKLIGKRYLDMIEEEENRPTGPGTYSQ